MDTLIRTFVTVALLMLALNFCMPYLPRRWRCVGLPPRFVWPKSWRRAYVVWLPPHERYYGVAEFYYDWPIPGFGFWFFHVCLDYR